MLKRQIGREDEKLQNEKKMSLCQFELQEMFIHAEISARQLEIRAATMGSSG